MSISNFSLFKIYRISISFLKISTIFRFNITQLKLCVWYIYFYIILEISYLWSLIWLMRCSSVVLDVQCFTLVWSWTLLLEYYASWKFVQGSSFLCKPFRHHVIFNNQHFFVEECSIVLIDCLFGILSPLIGDSSRTKELTEFISVELADFYISNLGKEFL